jgi:hypothetical protein
MTLSNSAVEKNTPKKSISPAATIEPIMKNAENVRPDQAHGMSEHDIQDTLDQLDIVDVDDSDNETSYDNYPRSFTYRFPKECREMFGLAGFEIPVRDVLEFYMQAQPDNRDLLRNIRDEF